MTLGSFVTLKDMDTTTPLFGGSEIHCHVNKVDFTGRRRIGFRAKSFTEPGLITADNDSLGSNWERRKGVHIYVGAGPETINIGGNWVTDVGSKSEGGTEFLSPFKLWVMKRSHHTFWFKDEIIIPNLIVGEDGVSLYTGSGVPIVIKDDSAKDILTNGVSWNLSLEETKVEN